MPEVTFHNTDGLTSEVLRNTMVETVDQMGRITVDNEGGFASALTVFPMVNMNAPEEGYYTFGGVSGGMPAAAPDAESPLGTLTLPSKRNYDTHSYKRKINPKKEAEVELDGDDVPFSLFNYGATYLQMETFIRREIAAWRGDEHIEGLIGPDGQTAHSDISSEDNVYTSYDPWSDTSDTTNATPYEDVVHVSHDLKTQGRFMGNQSRPFMFAGPDVLRDMRLNPNLQERLGSTQNSTLNVSDLSGLMSDDLAGIREVAVQVPRTNDDGEMVDDTGGTVSDAEDAAMDNILEPYDVSADTKRRNVIIGSPGPNSAFMPWFLSKLTTMADNAPTSSSISVDNQRGFLTQLWAGDDPISTYMAAKQDIGLHIRRPENWAILQEI